VPVYACVCLIVCMYVCECVYVCLCARDIRVGCKVVGEKTQVVMKAELFDIGCLGSQDVPP